MQAKPLQHARAHRVTVVQLQIPAAITKREDATTMQPKSNQQPGVYSRHQETHDRHHAHKSPRHPATAPVPRVRPYTHHLLQKLWYQHRAGIHHEAKEKMAIVAIAKLRFFSMCKSTTGSFCRSSQKIPATMPMIISTKKTRMKSTPANRRAAPCPR